MTAGAVGMFTFSVMVTLALWTGQITNPHLRNLLGLLPFVWVPLFAATIVMGATR